MEKTSSQQGNPMGGQPFAPRKERGIDSFRRTITTRHSTRRPKGKSPLLAVMKGVLIAACLTVIGVAAFALALNWWNASDRAITAINQVVKFVSILAGVTAAMSDGAGPLRGAMVGLVYMALGIVCYCLLLGMDLQWTAYLADLGMGLAAGGLFGMILTAKK